MKLFLFVYGMVFNSSIGKSLLALHACATFATVLFATFVTTPCLCVVNTYAFPDACDVALCDICVWRNYFHVIVCACCGCIVDGIDEIWTAVGIDGVVASMVGYEYSIKAVAFGYADCY